MRRAEAAGAGIGVDGLSKAYGKTPVLETVDLAVRPREFVCLLGPSGCGKTTLLRSIAGLERPDRGRIAIGGVVSVDVAQGVFVPPEQRGLGMVFQHYALWPHMTVGDNLAYPLRKRRLSADERASRTRRVMEMVGLPPVLVQHRPGQLSGGQQQRVALARALIYEPPVLLLDEPLSNLDAVLRVQLRRELRQLHERLGTTTLLVTHDQEEAASLADTIAVMDAGRIVQIGRAAEILDAPQTRFVAEFVGFDNLIAGRVTGVNGAQTRIAVSGAGELDLAAPAAARVCGADVLIAARSDKLRLCDAKSASGATLGGKIRNMVRHGRGVDFEITLGEQLVFVRDGARDGAAAFVIDGNVTIDFRPGPAVVLAQAADQRAGQRDPPPSTS